MSPTPLHKMLGQIRPLQKIRPLLAEGFWLLILLAVAFGAFTWNRDSVFFGREIYYLDGDCYSRMTRVQMLEEGGLRAIRHHAWENFPEGTRPHTTMPLDALILGLSRILGVFSERPLELAGAWISPLLGAGMILFLAWWSAVLCLPYRRAVTAMVAVSPIVAHGFQVGRPDHQSLLMVLMAVALAAEVGMLLRRQAGSRGDARQHTPPWGYVAAGAWGLALWVSLFEPLVLLGVVWALRGTEFLWRRAKGESTKSWHASRGPGVVFCAILATGLLVDGWRAAGFHPAFARWALNIGELQGAGWHGIFSWCGWLIAVGPGFLLWRGLRGGGSVCGWWLVLVLVLSGLSFYHSRWGYFLALVFAMSLPWALSALRRPWLAWSVFVISLWPVAAEWDRVLFPDVATTLRRAENLSDAVALREAALSLRGMPHAGVVAPWWFSPAIVWWSGQPCVGGTSHQSLPGILDSCGFYLASDPALAGEVLRRLGAGYVFAYEPARVVSNSEQILGRAQSGRTLAKILYDQPNAAPVGWEIIFKNQFFRVYRVPF